MNKDTFLKALKKQLKNLKPTELRKNISYYEELISDMVENGLSEEDAVRKIGSPKQAASEILENTAPENFRRKDIFGRILTAASAITVLLSLVEAVRIHTITAAAVSIIGGADGPTSIFIAGKLGWPRIYAVAAVVVGVTIVYFIWRYWREHSSH